MIVRLTISSEKGFDVFEDFWVALPSVALPSHSVQPSSIDTAKAIREVLERKFNVADDPDELLNWYQS